MPEPEVKQMTVAEAVEAVQRDKHALSQDAAVEVVIAAGVSKAETRQVYASFDRVAKRLPEDVRLEIGQHYENPAITLDEIRQEYGVGLGVIMAIVDDLQLPRRSQSPGFKRGKRPGPGGYFSMVDGKRIWMAGRKPTASQRAYEKGLRDAQHNRPALPARVGLEPKPEAVQAVVVPPVERRTGAVWRVGVETIVEIEAERIEDVIVQTRIQYPGAVITSINPAGR